MLLSVFLFQNTNLLRNAKVVAIQSDMSRPCQQSVQRISLLHIKINICVFLYQIWFMSCYSLTINMTLRGLMQQQVS